jgi:endoglucanase
MGGRAVVATTTALTPCAALRPAAGVVRVDQIGYLPGEGKHARLATTRRVTGARFRVVDQAGHVVLHGQVPKRSVRWNAQHPAVYRLSFSRPSTPGRYRIRFDHVQRDGASVVAGPLHGKPSQLLDRSAHVYAWPRMERGSDLILDNDLRPVRGTST